MCNYAVWCGPPPHHVWLPWATKQGAGLATHMGPRRRRQRIVQVTISLQVLRGIVAAMQMPSFALLWPMILGGGGVASYAHVCLSTIGGRRPRGLWRFPSPKITNITAHLQRGERRGRRASALQVATHNNSSSARTNFALSLRQSSSSSPLAFRRRKEYHIAAQYSDRRPAQLTSILQPGSPPTNQYLSSL
jgi:hypothetical protein